ncbi:tetratricopeptide repeat protein [Streptomyces cinnamoneus]|uniref:tetratricopeptide repeat protein n=1 Tax=Streptomyces cinnamoneus TaxID=53446 RepID=UPI0037A4E3BF
MTIGLDRSYWNLPRGVPRVYRRLGFLPLPQTDIALTAAASNLTPDEAHHALHALSTAGLLEDVADHPVRGRIWQLHDEVRVHARAQAAREDTSGTAEETLHRSLDWYQSGATAAEQLLTPAHRTVDRPLAYPPAQSLTFTERAEALAWLDGQQAQLMAAIRAGHAAGLYTSVWRLVWALWPLWHYGQVYSLWLEAHELALDAAQRDGAPLAQREILNTLGVGLRSAGRHDAAIGVFSRVRDMALMAADTAGQARVAHHGVGRRREAAELLQQARQQRVELGDSRGQALTDIVLGEIALDDSRPDEAIARFTTARALLLEEEDPHNAGRALAWLGRAHAHRGDFQIALDHGRTSIEELTRAGSRRWVGRSVEMLGQSAHESGHAQGARELFEQAMAAYEGFSSSDVERLRTRLRAVP